MFIIEKKDGTITGVLNTNAMPVDGDYTYEEVDEAAYNEALEAIDQKIAEEQAAKA